MYITVKAFTGLHYSENGPKPATVKGFSKKTSTMSYPPGCKKLRKCLPPLQCSGSLNSNYNKIFCGYGGKPSKFVFQLKLIKISTMNKAELIEKLAKDAGITKTQANATLDSFVEAVTRTLKKGDKVTLVGFGTFSVTKRAARNGRNPQTGAVIKIKAKKVARFKPGK